VPSSEDPRVQLHHGGFSHHYELSDLDKVIKAIKERRPDSLIT